MPLGWHITVYRQPDGGRVPAKFGAEAEVWLAVWQTGIHGLKWLNDLVAAGHGIKLGGNGYPIDYTARARYVMPLILGEPPEAKAAWTYDEGDIITPAWLGKTTKDEEAMKSCLPEEWLLIRAWDES